MSHYPHSQLLFLGLNTSEPFSVVTIFFIVRIDFQAHDSKVRMFLTQDYQEREAEELQGLSA